MAITMRVSLPDYDALTDGTPHIIQYLLILIMF